MQEVHTKQAPKAIGPYSQAVKAGELLFVSGQIPIDPQTGKLVEDTIEAQTKQVLSNLQAILEAAGGSLQHVVKTEIYLRDLQDFQAVNALYAEAFCYSVKPARQTMQVSRLPLDARIEISCVAYLEAS